MFTITLRIGCYDDHTVKGEFRKFIKRKGWGNLQKANLLSQEDGYWRYAVDVMVKNPEEFIHEIEMISCGLEAKPKELEAMNFDTIGYRITAIPQDFSPEDAVGLINQCMQSNILARSSLVSVLARVTKLEQTVAQSPEQGDTIVLMEHIAGVINELSTEVFGHNMIEIDNRNNYEVKPKWLH